MRGASIYRGQILLFQKGLKRYTDITQIFENWLIYRQFRTRNSIVTEKGKNSSIQTEYSTFLNVI